MADVTAAMVKELRDATGAGMMDCKRALIEADGDVVRATELLREKGLASAAKRAGRNANQGLVDAYIHFNNTVGALVEVNCETDFVANTDEFRQLVKDLALPPEFSLETMQMFVDWQRDAPFEVIRGEGECAV